MAPAPPPRKEPRAPAPPRGLAALALAAALAAAGCGGDDNPYFGSSTRTGKPPSTFYVNAGPEPETIDPGRASDAVATLFVSHLYEGLSVYDPRDTHPTQGVAKAWDKSDDNRLFRFHLREEARWSDGRRVTASDFAYSWGRVLRPFPASRAASILYVLLNGELYQRGLLKVAVERTPVLAAPSEGGAPVAALEAGAAVRVLETKGEYVQIARHERLPTFDPARPPPPPVEKPEPLGFVRASALAASPSVLGVRAVDDGTLEVETEHPTPYFLDLTSYSALVPVRRDVVEPLEKAGKLDLLSRPENVVGNGAYRIADWKFRYEVVTTKSPTYWRAGEVKIDRVVWAILDEMRAALNLYTAGDLDYIGDNSSIVPELIPFAEKKKDFVRANYLAVYWYDLNTRKPPLDDVRVRRALDLAIDKTQLVQKVTRSGQTPATHFVPDFTGSGYSDVAAADRQAGTDPFAAPGTDFDPERARALLREAGYAIEKDGDGFQIKGFPALEILYNTNEGNRAIAVTIQAYWRQNLGISAQIRNEEFKVMLKSVQEGNYQVARGGWISEYNHPLTWLDTFLSYSPQNRTGWADPEYDRLLKEGSQTADLTASIRKLREAERRAVDGMPRIPFYFYTKNSLVKPWVKGFYPNPRGLHLAQWLWIDPSGGAAENRPAANPLEYDPPGPFARPAAGGAP